MRKYIQTRHQSIEEFNGGYNVAVQQMLLVALRQDVESVPVGVSCYFFIITRNFLRSVEQMQCIKR